jgi:hypothetical protein
MGHKKKNQKNEQPIGGYRLFSSARILCLVSSSSDSFDRSPSNFIVQFQSFLVVVVLHLECWCEAEDMHHQL